jgi:hypothetical protein
MPAITRPDSSVRRFDAPVTGATIAEATRAARHRRVDDVATGQQLAKAEQVGELGRRHPASLLDNHATWPGQRAAEAADADGEAAHEQGAQAWPDGCIARPCGIPARSAMDNSA